MISEKRTVKFFQVLIYLSVMNLFAQEKTRKVNKDTLFFNYDHAYLKKTLPDLNLVCITEDTNSTSLHTSLNFELEEVRTIKTDTVLNLKRYLQRKGLYNEKHLSYRHQKIFDKFNSNVVIFIDTTKSETNKFYKASAILGVE
ncbi:hypothetical protein [Maribacter sp. 1_MG-2023]|uniref:hypothetical protein n=1 Tax=Maribacter sp. 1_MG-2023 TaxID=3062677 RepID=UPI0026E3ABC3|nr:hypothetical protein [Maribacter sp. 1_MG-2023]MDO6471003.1 hypothetical protein [Maribacter sp. 1_MG-2023]